MSFSVLYSEHIKKDLKKISKSDQVIIQKNLEKKVFQNPKIFSKPLKNTLFPLRSARINNFRVVFEIKKSTILVLAIAHRQDIYMIAQQRKN